jgi:carboxynorspermidine decarboxylase
LDTSPLTLTLTQEQINNKYKNIGKTNSAYICELEKVERNMHKIKELKEQTGIKVLIALKGSSLPATWDICRKYVDGATSSGLYECRLAHEFSDDKLEVHTFSPSFMDYEIDEILDKSHHIVFNSISQLLKYQDKALNKGVEIALRINPEFSSVKFDIYNPCKPFSRFGVTQNELNRHLDLNPSCLDNVSAIHCHAFCMNKGKEVEELLQNIELKFGNVLSKISTINMGGGNDVTLDDYDTRSFISAVNAFKERNTNIKDFYIEPGYSILANTGVLVGEVVDIVNNGVEILILNISASCHSPDVLEYGFRHPVLNEVEEGQGQFRYLVSSNTCLSGDEFGYYSFNYPINIGDKFVFEDAISYTFVKSTHFNGVPHPSIAIESENVIGIVKSFEYDDFRNRLG